MQFINCSAVSWLWPITLVNWRRISWYSEKVRGNISNLISWSHFGKSWFLDFCPFSVCNQDIRFGIYWRLSRRKKSHEKWCKNFLHITKNANQGLRVDMQSAVRRQLMGKIKKHKLHNFGKDFDKRMFQVSTCKWKYTSIKNVIRSLKRWKI